MGGVLVTLSSCEPKSWSTSSKSASPAVTLMMSVATPARERHAAILASAGSTTRSGMIDLHTSLGLFPRSPNFIGA